MATPKTPLRELLETIVYALVIALLVRFFVVEVYVVDGPSMENTLHSYERLLVNKFVYRIADPQRGDVVVFRYPGDLNGTRWPLWTYCLVHQCRDFVKRVVAVGGDTLEIRQGQVILNGTPLSDPVSARRDHDNRPVRTVPPGTIWVMGDNRPNSDDSRAFGPVDLKYVKGKAFLRFWPISQWHWLNAQTAQAT